MERENETFHQKVFFFRADSFVYNILLQQSLQKMRTSTSVFFSAPKHHKSFLAQSIKVNHVTVAIFTHSFTRL